MTNNIDMSEEYFDDEQNQPMTFEPTEDTEYTMYLTIVNELENCPRTDSIIIYVDADSYLTAPDIFTPNGDDINDKFMVTYKNICEVNGMIFNRWGEKLYQWEGVETGWDGRTMAGVEVPDGVYFFIISGKGCDGKLYGQNDPTLTGSVTVVR